MKLNLNLILSVVALAAILLAACGPSAGAPGVPAQTDTPNPPLPTSTVVPTSTVDDGTDVIVRYFVVTVKGRGPLQEMGSMDHWAFEVAAGQWIEVTYLKPGYKIVSNPEVRHTVAETFEVEKE